MIAFWVRGEAHSHELDRGLLLYKSKTNLKQKLSQRQKGEEVYLGLNQWRSAYPGLGIGAAASARCHELCRGPLVVMLQLGGAAHSHVLYRIFRYTVAAAQSIELSHGSLTAFRQLRGAAHSHEVSRGFVGAAFLYTIAKNALRSRRCYLRLNCSS